MFIYQKCSIHVVYKMLENRECDFHSFPKSKLTSSNIVLCQQSKAQRCSDDSETHNIILAFHFSYSLIIRNGIYLIVY